MSESPNKLIRFWNELKRRKVIRIATVYAAAAFIILQLTDIIAQPLQLPSWTLPFVIVLLCIGFIIAVLLTWIYDITPEGVQMTKPVDEVKSNEKVKPIVSNGWKITSYISIVIIVAYVAFNFITNRKQPEKTIAVLPFRNLSNDSTQLYFSDGLMEEILDNLQNIKSFTVRPRTSSSQYRDGKKSTVIIGNELNVNYLVEGSVGHEGNNLKIWVQLIDSKADKQMWSHDYPCEEKQLFSVQSDIAKEIASGLKAELTPEEIKKIKKKPTGNLKAYNYYLQGNYYYKASGSGANNTAIELYKKATGLDPGFALAFTRIAICLLDQYFNYEDHTEDILRKSKEAIDKAIKIDPDLPEAHLALGIYYYRGCLKYPEALKQFELILEDQPKNSEAIFWSAIVHRRTGDWKMAKSDFVKALELDPRRSDMAEDAGETFELLREYSKAEEFYNMSVMLQPDWVFPYPLLSRMYLSWEGDMRKARETLGNAERNNKNSVSDSLIIETNVLLDIYEGKYEEALKDMSRFKNDAISTQFYFRPKYLYYATIYGLMNKPVLERAYYDSTRKFLEKRIFDSPEDQRLHSSLGIVYAGLGLDSMAIRAGKKAIKLLPVSKDAYRGVFLVEDLALIYVMVGKYDDAVKQIKYLLSNPGFLSTKILELDPRWAPLRNQPEFKKLLQSYSVK
jgi:TolB-like protein/Flp pilus assembly protein TadD